MIPTRQEIFGKRSKRYDLVAIHSTAAIIGTLSTVVYAFTYFNLKKQSRNYARFTKFHGKSCPTHTNPQRKTVS